MRASRSRRPSGSSELTGSSRISSRGPADDRLGDAEPLAHPARIASDPSPGGIGEPDALERLVARRTEPPRAIRPWSPPANSTSSRPVIQP